MRFLFHTVCFLVFLLSGNQGLFAQTLTPKLGNAKYALIDEEGNDLTGFIYDDIMGFSDGLCRVRQGGETLEDGRVVGGKWGYINREGEMVIPLEYDYAWYFTEGLAAVRKGDQWMYIDTEGNEKLKVDYDFIWHFKDGFAKVNKGGGYTENGFVSGGKFGFIDIEGNEVIPTKYHYCWYPEDGYIKLRKRDPFLNISIEYYHIESGEILVESSIPEKPLERGEVGYSLDEENGYWGVFNDRFEQIIPYKYKEIKIGDNGLFAVNYQGNWGIIDSLENTIVPLQYDWLDAPKGDLVLVKKNLQFGYLNVGKGKPIAPQYELARPFKDGRAVVGIERKWGFVDETGTFQIEDRFSEARVFKNGFAAVADHSGRWNYVDREGQLLGLFRYDEVMDFDGQVAFVKQYGKWGVINSQGRTTIYPKYDQVERFIKEFAKVGIYEDENNIFLNWGFVNSRGEEVVTPQYPDVFDFFDGVAQFSGERFSDIYGLLDTAGQVILEPNYNNIGPFEDGFAEVFHLSGKYGIIDRTGKIIVPCEYGSIERQENGNFLVGELTAEELTRYGLIDPEGEWKIPFNLSEFAPYGFDRFGRAEVKSFPEKLGGKIKTGLINRGGDFVIPMEYDAISSYGEDGYYFGRLIQENETEAFTEFYFFDVEGRPVNEEPFIDVNFTSLQSAEGLSIFTYRDEQGKYGLASVDGKVLLEPTFFEEVYLGNEANFLAFQNGAEIFLFDATGKRISDRTYQEFGIFPSGKQFVNFKRGGKWGYMDTDGKEVYPPTFDYGYFLEDGHAKVRIKNNLGILRNWKLIIPCEYQEILIRDQLYMVQKNDKWAVFNWNGKQKTDFKYTVFGNPKWGMIQFVENGLTGVVNKDGKEIVPAKYTQIDYDIWDDDSLKVIKVYKRGKGMKATDLGLYDTKGKKLLSPKYDILHRFHKDLMRAEIDGKDGMLNRKMKRVVKPEYDLLLYYADDLLAGRRGEEWDLLKPKRNGKYRVTGTYEDLKWLEGWSTKPIGFKKDGMYGLMDSLGQVFVEAKFDTIHLYTNSGPVHFIPARKTDIKYYNLHSQDSVSYEYLYGLMDQEGTLLLDCVHSYVIQVYGTSSFWIGKRPFKEQSGVYFLETEQFLPLNFLDDYALIGARFGLFPDQSDNLLWGFKNTSGTWVVPPLYTDWHNFEQGTAWVKREGYWIPVDTLGQELIPLQHGFDELRREFDNGWKEVRVKDKWGLANREGQLKIPANYDYITNYSEGIATANIGGYRQFRSNDLSTILPNGSWALVDTTGREIIAIEDGYDEIRGITGGLIPVKKYGRWGWVNMEGELVLNYEFDDLGNYSEGYAWVKKNRKYSFVDTTGLAIAPSFTYDGAGNVKEGMVKVKKGQKWDILDIENDMDLGVAYDEIYSFQNGYAVVNEGGEMETESGPEKIRFGKFGLIDLSGMEILPTVFDGLVPATKQISTSPYFELELVDLRRTGRLKENPEQPNIPPILQASDFQRLDQQYFDVSIDGNRISFRIARDKFFPSLSSPDTIYTYGVLEDQLHQITITRELEVDVRATVSQVNTYKYEITHTPVLDLVFIEAMTPSIIILALADSPGYKKGVFNTQSGQWLLEPRYQISGFDKNNFGYWVEGRKGVFLIDSKGECMVGCENK